MKKPTQQGGDAADEFDVKAKGDAPAPAPLAQPAVTSYAAQRKPLPKPGPPPPLIKKPEPESEKEAEAKLPKEEFPTDLREALRLLTQLDNDPNANSGSRAEIKVRAQRLQRLRKHVHTLQQLPHAPSLSANDLALRNQFVHKLRDRKRDRLKELATKNPKVAALSA